MDNIGILIRSILQAPNDTDITKLKSQLEQKLGNVKINTNGKGIKILDEKEIDRYKQHMSNMLQNLRSRYSGLLDKGDIQSQISSFKSALGSFGTTNSNNSMKDLNLQFETLTSNIKSSSGALRLTHKDAMSVGDAFKQAFEKFPIWLATSTLIMAAIHKIGESFQFILEQSKVFTNLQMEMTNTALDFKEITTTANEYAQAMGATTDTVMKAISVFSTYTSTMDEVLQKSKAGIVLNNITGQGIETTADALMGTLAQYKLAAEDSMHVADIITGTARMLQIDYPKAVQEISDGLRTVGAVARESGASIELTAAMVGTVSEKNRRTGIENSNALRTIFGRILNVGEDADPEAMKKVEASLHGIGVAVREIGDPQSLRPIGNILADLSGKWSNLTDVQRQNIAFEAAGMYRKNTFITLMENYGDVIKNTEAAINSQGVAMQKQEIYENSLTAATARLQAQWESLYLSALNNDFIKGFVNTLSGLMGGFVSLSKTIGFLPVTIGVVVGALSLFKKEWSAFQTTLSINPLGKISGLQASGGFLKGIFDSLSGVKERYIALMEVSKQYNAQVGSQALSTNVLSVGFQALTGKTIAQTMATVGLTIASTALNVALTMGLSFAITGIISGISSLINHWSNAAEAQKKFIQDTQNNVKSLTDQKKGLQELSQEYETLKNKEQNLSATTQEKQRLLEVQKELVDKYSVSITGINAEGEAYSDSIEVIKLRTKALEDEIKAQERNLEVAVQARDSKDVSDIQSQISKREVALREILKLQEAIKNPFDSARGNTKLVSYEDAEGLPMDLQSAKDLLVQFTNDLESSNTSIKELSKDRSQYLQNYAQDTIKQLESNGNKVSDSAKAFASEFAKSLAISPQDIATQKESLKKFVNELSQSGFDELIKKYNDAKSKKDNVALKVASDDINNFVGTMAKGKPELDSFVLSIANMYNPSIEAGNAVDELNEALNFDNVDKSTENLQKLTSILDELKGKDGQISNDSFKYLLENYPQLLKYMDDNARLKKELTKISKAEDEKIKQSYIDLINKKFATDEAWYTTNIKNNQTFLKKIEELYGVNLQQEKNLGSAKLAVNNKIIQELAGSWGSYFDSLGNLTDNFYDELEKMDDDGRTPTRVVHNRFNKGKALAAQIKVELANANAEFDKISLKGIDLGGVDFSGGKDNKGGTSSQSAEKQTSEVVLEKDRYFGLNQELAKTNALLEKNKSLQENATLKQKLELLKDEQTLLKQKQKNIHAIADAERKERDGLVKSLKGSGVKFSGSGDDTSATNAQSILDAKLNQVNSHRNDKNKTTYNKLKAEYDALEKSLTRFFDLQSKEIPNLQKDYNGLVGDIRNVVGSIENIELDSKFDEIDKSAKEFSDTIEYLDFKLQMLGDNNVKDKMDILNKKISATTKHLEDTQKALDDLNDDPLPKGADALQKYKDKVEALNKELQQGKLAINGFSKEVDGIYADIKSSRIDLEQQLTDALKKEYEDDLQNKKDVIQKKVDAEVDSLNKIKDANRKFFDEQKYQESQQEKRDKIEENNKKIARLSLDNSGTYSSEIAQLKKENKDLSKELQDSSIEHTLKATEDIIDAQIKSIEDKGKASTDALETPETQKKAMDKIKLDVENMMKQPVETIINFLKNTEEFKNAGKYQAVALIDGWTETIEKAKSSLITPDIMKALVELKGLKSDYEKATTKEEKDKIREKSATVRASIPTEIEKDIDKMGSAELGVYISKMALGGNSFMISMATGITSALSAVLPKTFEAMFANIIPKINIPTINPASKSEGASNVVNVNLNGVTISSSMDLNKVTTSVGNVVINALNWKGK